MKAFRVLADARRGLDGIWELASSPSAGVSVPGFEGEGTRKFPMGNYLIYYRAARGKVTIWRVLHGKRIQFRLLRGCRR